MKSSGEIGVLTDGRMGYKSVLGRSTKDIRLWPQKDA
jgi:hypothetical protein